MNWFAAEPTQGKYDWAVLDQVIDGATSRGLSVLAVLAYTPGWASQANVDGKETLNDVPKVGTYASFVTAAVTHFAGRVTHYELWNEPNLGQFFEGTPADYTARVLVPGADAVHAACAGCKVVAPGLASLAVSSTTVARRVAHRRDADRHRERPVYAGFLRTAPQAHVGQLLPTAREAPDREDR